MRRLGLFLVLALAAASGGAAWWFWPREAAGPPGFQGYVEGNLVFVAGEEGGQVAAVVPAEGDAVAAGDVVVRLDATLQQGARDETAARLAQARSSLADLRASLQRPEEIAVLQAAVDQARANLDYSTREYERQKNLSARGFATTTTLDQARSAFDRDTAALAQAQRQIEAARIGGRSGAIEAAEAAVEAASAALAQAQTRLDKRVLRAPAAAPVQEIFFRPGEVVTAGQPILSLLPPGNLKVRFYVPETRLSRLALGQSVEVACDGCGAPIPARVAFLADQAEYTPPVIFSREERAKLVFRAEARLEGGRVLPVGLPVGVRPPEQAAEAAP